jgi:hypothetical protein
LGRRQANAQVGGGARFGVRVHPDEQAASPLVVIATFVGVAILLTVGIYALVFDRPEDRLQVVERETDGELTLEVTQAAGGLDWEDVTLRYLDRAGTDQAASFLVKPSGGVDEGDVIHVSPRPPAGSYVFIALRDGQELSRLVVEV